MINFNKILMWVSMVVCAGIFIYLIWVFYVFLKKAKFSKKYGIGKLPRSIKIKKAKDNESQRNHFVLKYPYWRFSKQDGTADRRVKDNDIIWRKSKLYIDTLMLVSERPYDILQVVGELRSQGNKIALCKEEKLKYNKLYERKEVFSDNCSIQNIIDFYEEKPTNFEKLCAELFYRMGYDSKVTPQSNDGGYDILLSQDDYRIIVECKCYSLKNKVGRPAIQKLVGANTVIEADRMIFITTSDFSENAVIYAQEAGVELINGYDLLRLLDEYAFWRSKKLMWIYQNVNCEYPICDRMSQQISIKDIFADYSECDRTCSKITFFTLKCA